MKILRNMTKAFLLLAVVAGLLLGSGVVAFAQDVNYTDGTIGQDANGNDWGAPPQPPFVSQDNEAQVCIDPPQNLYMTLHVIADGEEVDSRTFEYIHVPEKPYACTDLALPVCPAEEIEVYGTWNIGVGRSPSLFVNNDCPDPMGEVVVTQDCETGTSAVLTNTGDATWQVDDEGVFAGLELESGASSEPVDVGRDAGSLAVEFDAGPKTGEASVEWAAQPVCPVIETSAPPVELAPPAQVTAAPTGKTLAFTGTKDTLWIYGSILAGAGVLMVLLGGATKRRKVAGDN